MARPSRGLSLGEGGHRPLGLPERLHGGDAAVVVDDVDHDQVCRRVRAVGERRADRADVGAGVAARVGEGVGDRELEGRDRRDRQLPEGPDPLVAVVAAALRVEHGGPDRVLEHRVLGVHRQPLGQVALRDRGVGAHRGHPGRVLVGGGAPVDGVGGDRGGTGGVGGGAHPRDRTPELERVLVVGRASLSPGRAAGPTPRTGAACASPRAPGPAPRGCGSPARSRRSRARRPAPRARGRRCRGRPPRETRPGGCLRPRRSRRRCAGPAG